MVERYISEPIISRYMVFSAEVRRIGDMAGESGVRSTPGSIGVNAGLALSMQV